MARAITADWRKSSFSGDSNCVEIRLIAGMVEIRDSKDSKSPVLQFTHGEWIAFLAGVHNGEFALD